MSKRHRVAFVHFCALLGLLGLFGAILIIYDRQAFRRTLKVIHDVGSFAPGPHVREVKYRA